MVSHNILYIMFIIESKIILLKVDNSNANINIFFLFIFYKGVYPDFDEVCTAESILILIRD